MPHRAKDRLEALAKSGDELRRVKAQAEKIRDRVSADLHRAEQEDANMPPPKKKSTPKRD